MNEQNYIQITVNKVIHAPGRGVLAMGHMDAGEVKLGDALQVHNPQPGATARVGQISLGTKSAKKARAGEEVLLLLDNLTAEAVQPGDRLMIGEVGKIAAPPAEEVGGKLRDEPWEKLPERIQPILHFGQFTGKIGILAFLSIFGIAGIFGIIVIPRSSEGICPLMICVLFCAVSGYIAYGQLKKLVRGLRGRRRFLQSQSQTSARIMNRKAQFHEDEDGNYYTYHIQLEFSPTLASVNTGILQLEAEISQKLFESLLGRQSVNITYAVEDPHIFILEGE